ncbi:MFS transporter [Lichenibacterium dinghuense]|uniref:MFS transporter n=1 Tax=Lichenibacterium dinghuense TaxID=2895977 RepID=UPI001F459C5A|nr:MFS transporter [Lichenibacterium sp. 6Y81]
MSATEVKIGAPLAEGVYRRVTLRLIPFLFVCYTFAFLDRINIGVAKLEMVKDLGLDDLIYSTGAGIFFLGYVLMRIPSNLMLARVGVRKTFSRILILWGLAAAGTAFVVLPWQLYSVRFLLGLFEAGLYPGVIFYLTRWYPTERRAKVIAIFTCATGIAGLIGGPLSGLLMTAFDGAAGLHGWQWMFIVEGLPTCLIGVAAFLYLDDGPAEAAWLSEPEKAMVLRNLDGSTSEAGHGAHSFTAALADYRVYLLALIWFTQICGVFVIGFWLPTIIKNFGINSPLHVGLLSAIPYLCSWIALILAGRSSDARNERAWHCGLPMLAGAVGLVAAGLITTSLPVSLVFLSVATAGILACNPILWAIATEYLRGKAAAGAIAVVNTIGLLGGYVSPMIMGWAKTLTGDLATGLYVIAAILVVGALVSIVFTPAMLRARRTGLPAGGTVGAAVAP